MSVVPRGVFSRKQFYTCQSRTNVHYEMGLIDLLLAFFARDLIGLLSATRNIDAFTTYTEKRQLNLIDWLMQKLPTR